MFIGKIMSVQTISDTIRGNKKYFVEQTENTFELFTSNKESIFKFDKEDHIDLPFLFFILGSKEYLIMSPKKSKYIIVDCWIGHIEEGEIQCNYIWKSIYQIDDNTIGVLGNNNEYSFYQFSRNKLVEIQIYQDDKVFYFPLTLEPEIKIKEYSIVDFHIYETFVNGIGIHNTTKNIEEIDMQLNKYESQESLSEGHTLPFYKSKTYPRSSLRIEFQRQDDRMIVCSFWSIDEIQKDKPENYNDELIPYLPEIKNNYTCIPSKIMIYPEVSKSFLYLYPKQSWKLIRNYFILSFDKVEDGYYYQLKSNSFKNGNMSCLSTNNLNKVISLLN
jgi:hypothetical protein